MKRILALMVLTTSCAQATDIAQAWKDLSRYRAVSGVKAVLVGLAAIHAAHQTIEAGKLAANVITDDKDINSRFGWERGNRIIGLSVLTLGMAYTAWVLGYDYFIPYAKHALAV